ncbi:DUF7502 family protein [Haloplanus aerogenes]|uniref:Uncharacterized protein n=1 Tax=Haloplanus aerogenes TaxID=660522 RepID=A0A3M0DI23_9EURY|nr:hypothetical protein [Haloplanus aerogenes]AZH26141.1 hypothetical protein DU502_12575 [Haloplanus aerogenes]RMB18406.1 hypothetical protein ATH50_1861 [Haloplanus aerogenes]
MSTSDTATAEEADDADPPTEARRIRRALTEIRREGWKVAVIYAVVDATLATLLVNLVATFVGGVPRLPTRLPIPPAILRFLRETVGVTLAEPTVSSAAVVGAAVGLLVFVVEVAWRVRRPLVEQFEAANPALRESLRTARDAVGEGRRPSKRRPTAGGTDRHSRMARRLYESVLDDLKRSSSIGLLDLRRVAVTVVLITAVSVATIHLAVVDITLAGLGDTPEAETPGGGTQSDYTGLQDGSSILGEPEDVPTGEENLDATVDTSGSGSGQGSDAESAAAYEDSGFGGDDAVESQRAGFTEREQLEDAELIREYNLRIRQESQETENE